MKVAYVFATSGHNVSYKLGKMILPQLEADRHGVEVVGMFFFDDNTYALRAGYQVGQAQRQDLLYHFAVGNAGELILREESRGLGRR